MNYSASTHFRSGTIGAGMVIAFLFLSPTQSILSISQAAADSHGTGQEWANPPRGIASLGALPSSLDEVESARKKCVKPSEKLTQDMVRAIARKYPSDHRQFRMRSLAAKEWQFGQISNAIRLQQTNVKMPHEWKRNLIGNQLFLAILLAEAGDFSQAEKTFNSAASSIKPAKDLTCRYRDEFWSARSAAAIAFAKGNLVEAEVRYLRAHESLEKLSKVSGKGDCVKRGVSLKAENLVRAAEAIMMQGRLGEAETMARQAHRLGRHFFSRKIKPQSFLLLSRIYFEQGRYEDARRVALGALNVLNEICAPTDAFFRAKAYENVARTFLGDRNWRDAADTFEKLEMLMTTDPDTWERLFRYGVDRGIALWKTGDHRLALEIFQRAAVGLSERLGDDDYRSVEARAFRAVVQAELGEHAAALELMRSTVPLMIKKWREAGGNATTFVGRLAKLRLIVEIYFRLLLDPTMSGDGKRKANVNEAFKIVSAVGARGVQQAIAEGTSRFVGTSPATAGLIESRQHLDRRLIGLRDRLNAATVSVDASAKDIDMLRKDVVSVEATLKKLRREIAVALPELTEMINPAPLAMADAQRLVLPGEVLVVTFSGETHLIVWAIPPQGAAMVALAAIGRRDLSRLIDDVRHAVDPGAISSISGIPAFNLRGAYRLYEHLLLPVKPIWKDAATIVLVADGPLGTLPISMLPTSPGGLPPAKELKFANYRDVAWLARTHAVAFTPSVAALRTLRETDFVDANRRPFVGFGDPYFNAQQAAQAAGTGTTTGADGAETRGIVTILRNLPNTRKIDSAKLALLPRLPDTANELLSIASILGSDPKTDVFLGKRANEMQVKGMQLDSYRVVAFATHGLIPGDLNGLNQPALALTSPDVAGVQGDGLLTMEEILNLKLNADWVILSACNTAAGEGKGAEAVSGLGRAFFYAGAKSLLVSNWPVFSTATSKLTTTLFHLQAMERGLSRAKVLQMTRLKMIDDGIEEDDRGTALFSYAHPIFWAPFTVVGEGGTPN